MTVTIILHKAENIWGVVNLAEFFNKKHDDGDSEFTIPITDWVISTIKKNDHGGIDVHCVPSGGYGTPKS